MTRRRELLIALSAGALAAPFAGFAQPQKIYRIGYLANDPDRASPTFQAFIGAMRELGWVEGKNIEIQYRTSGGRNELFPNLAAETVRENVDVIVTTGSPSTRAAKAATDSIPIVFGSAANPVEQKFVASLARPGGNVTGLALLVQELGPKRLQLMKEMLPRATRFARLYDVSGLKAIQPAIMTEYESAARALGVTIRHISVAHFDDIQPAFVAAVRQRVDALQVTADALFVVNRDLIAKLALEHQIPMMGPDGRFADAGALVSYGENFASRYRRAAFLVDKILRGAKPAEIPVEQPLVLQLVVNLKTAKRLGVAFPESFLLQADRVIR
jgi:putative ABC transport system substrate-binding protein